MPYLARRFGARCTATAAMLSAVALFAVSGLSPVAAGTVYKWVDRDGVTHLSSTKPPAGVAFERLSVAGSAGRPATKAGNGSNGSKGNVRLAAASPEQSARRNAVIEELQTRECVVALEAMDRLARGGKPVDPDEFKRLQQTADRNCSQDPATRRQQEEMAAKYRVSRSDECVDARNRLAGMLEPGRKPTREQLQTQQQFIERHCESPVR